MIDTLRFFYESFAEEQMNLLYTGDFTDELTDKLIELNNFQFNQSNELNSTQRKVGFLIAECFQNIVRHGDLSAIDSYFHTQNRRGVFSVISGNTVKDEMISTLQGQLEQLNKLTSEELKEIYRKTLSEGSFSEKGGAGLGLIEMARKTKNKLSFKFYKVDELRSLFYFQLQLKTPQYTGDKLQSSLDKSINLRNKMKEDHIFMIYKGLISSQIFQPITDMMENSIHSPRQNTVVLSLLSLLQLLSNQATAKEKIAETILVIGKDKSHHKIGSMIYIDNNEVSLVENLIENYQHQKQPQIEPNQSAYDSTLGEIAKNGSTIDYYIEKKSDELSLLTLSLTAAI